MEVHSLSSLLTDREYRQFLYASAFEVIKYALIPDKFYIHCSDGTITVDEYCAISGLPGQQETVGKTCQLTSTILKFILVRMFASGESDVKENHLQINNKDYTREYMASVITQVINEVVQPILGFIVMVSSHDSKEFHKTFKDDDLEKLVQQREIIDAKNRMISGIRSLADENMVPLLVGSQRAHCTFSGKLMIAEKMLEENDRLLKCINMMQKKHNMHIAAYYAEVSSANELLVEQQKQIIEQQAKIVELHKQLAVQNEQLIVQQQQLNTMFELFDVIKAQASGGAEPAAACVANAASVADAEPATSDNCAPVDSMTD